MFLLLAKKVISLSTLYITNKKIHPCCCLNPPIPSPLHNSHVAVYLLSIGGIIIFPPILPPVQVDGTQRDHNSNVVIFLLSIWSKHSHSSHVFNSKCRHQVFFLKKEKTSLKRAVLLPPQDERSSCSLPRTCHGHTKQLQGSFRKKTPESQL